MGFGVQRDGRIIHCGTAVAGMERLDLQVFENKLLEQAGFPPLHEFTVEDQMLIQERATERNRVGALSLQRFQEVEQRRKRLGAFGEFATLALHKTHYVTGIGFGVMAALYMEGSILQKLAAAFFAFWPGCIPGLFLGPQILHALKLEE